MLDEFAPGVAGLAEATGFTRELTAQVRARLVRRSLERGFYQGWDLRPAQLVTRYAATFAFFRESLPTTCARLATYHSRAAVQEEPATAKALASFLRGLNCGAYTETEIESLTHLNPGQLSFISRCGSLPELSPP